MRLTIAIASIAAMALSAPLPAAAQSGASGGAPIEWQVRDRFRFFGDQSDEILSEVYESYLSQSDARERANGRWVIRQQRVFASAARRAMLASATDDAELTACRGREDEVRCTHNRLRHRETVFAWNRRTRSYASGYVAPPSYSIEVWPSASLALSTRDCVWEAVSAQSSTMAPCSVDATRAVLLLPREPAPPSTERNEQDIVWRGELRLRAADGAIIATQSGVVVRDRLVIGIGDSVASGEGNPDIPSNWSAIEELFPDLADLGGDSGAGWYMTQRSARAVAGAVWLDEHCHRSLLSWQAISAIGMAAADPHSAVTFASFACGGAATHDGVLIGQSHPPGGLDFEFFGSGRVRYVPPELDRSERPRRWVELAEPRNEEVAEPAQISALAEFLCGGDDNLTTHPLVVLRDVESDANWEGALTDYSVCNTPLRPISSLLVSLGGNDVGFADAIVWAGAPNTGDNWMQSILFAVINDQFEGAKCPDRVLGDERCRESPDPGYYRYEFVSDTAEQCAGDYVRDENVIPRHRPTTHYLVTCYLQRTLSDALQAVGRTQLAQERPMTRDRVIWTSYPSAFWSASRAGPALGAFAPRNDLGTNGTRLCGVSVADMSIGVNERFEERPHLTGLGDSAALQAFRGGLDSLYRLPVVGPILGLPAANDYGLRITETETQHLSLGLHAPLNGRLLAVVGDDIVIDSYLASSNVDMKASGAATAFSPDNAYELGGWCANDNVDAFGGLQFPTVSADVGSFPEGRAPWDWNAYEPMRARLFRTPNDSALTQFPGPRRIRGDESERTIWPPEMQRRFSNSIGGSMHPTLTLHAIMAAAALERQRCQESRRANPTTPTPEGRCPAEPPPAMGERWR